MSVFTPQHERLLLAAFASAAPARRAWFAWEAEIDWRDHLDPVAMRLLPRLNRNLRRHGVEDGVLSRLGGVARKNWFANQALFQSLRPAFSVLHELGVPVTVLHPLGLSVLDPELRARGGDAPALGLPATLAVTSVRALRARGWETTVRLPDAWLAGYVVAQPALLLRKDGHYLRLVWRHPTSATGFARVEQPALLDGHVLVPDGVNYVGRLMTAAGADEPTQSAVLAAEMMLLSRTLATPLDWSAILQQASAAQRGRLAKDTVQALSRLFPAEVSAPIGILSIPPEIHADAGRPPVRGPLARWTVNWRFYRRRLGTDVSQRAALLAFPGYLMGKWHLGAPAQLPQRLWRSLRYRGPGRHRPRLPESGPRGANIGLPHE